jgi:hypothetical protein
MKRKVLIVISGVIVCFSTLAFSVLLMVNFTDARSIPLHWPKGSENLIDGDPVGAFENLIWRFEFVVNPLVVAVTSFAVGLLTKYESRLGLLLIALSPFFLLFVVTNSFSLRSFILLIFYGLLSVFVLWLQKLLTIRATD